MQTFLEFVVKQLVDRPDSVSVTAVDKNSLTVYELRLDSEDVGKIIGRKGATIQAIRSLLQAGSAKQGKRCTVDIIEDDDGL